MLYYLKYQYTDNNSSILGKGLKVNEKINENLRDSYNKNLRFNSLCG
jgi:hypothetical protein